MARIKYSDLEARAEQLGLSLSYWAPGDGFRRYKVFDKPGVDYFQDDGIYRTASIRELEAFLAGYARCVYKVEI